MMGSERAKAAEAARLLRVAWGNPELMGARSIVHIDLARPRRGVWQERWSNLPGFFRQNGQYGHALLPGWGYTAEEVAREMIPDLERLAETGELPTEATR